MKVTLLLLAGFLTFNFSYFAQEATSITEKADNIGTENGTVLSTKINRATEKDIIKEWKSKMKGFDGDVKAKKTTISATGVKIESIDLNPIQVFAQVRKSTDQEMELVVMFLKNGVPLNSNTDLSGFTAAKSIVRNFANKMSKEATEDYRKDQIKAFEKLQKELESAQKELERAEKAIKESKKAIKEAEATIKDKTKFVAENKKTQAGLMKKLEEQKKVVKTANDEAGLF